MDIFLMLLEPFNMGGKFVYFLLDLFPDPIKWLLLTSMTLLFLFLTLSILFNPTHGIITMVQGLMVISVIDLIVFYVLKAYYDKEVSTSEGFTSSMQRWVQSIPEAVPSSFDGLSTFLVTVIAIIIFVILLAVFLPSNALDQDDDRIDSFSPSEERAFLAAEKIKDIKRNL